MTITSPGIIRNLIKGDGVAYGDPQALVIYTYTTPEGEIAYAVFHHGIEVDIYESPYAHNPILLWSRDTGVTTAGRSFMEAHEWKPEKSKSI